MNAPDQHVEVPVPEEAIEPLAVWHYNLTHDIGEHHGTPWAKASADEKAKSLDQARYRLQAAAPFIAAKAVEEAEAQRDAAYKAEEIANRERDQAAKDAEAERTYYEERTERERDQAVQQERERLRELVAWLRSSGGMIDRFVVADRIAALEDQEGDGA